MDRFDRYRGCLLGGAAGDALGYPVEFDSRAAILSAYGPQGITDYVLTDGTAQISDDTQMTLFTANALLFADTRRRVGAPGGTLEGATVACYQDWLRTQQELYPRPDGDYISWLAHVPELYHRRAPGNTCLTAIGQGAKGTIIHPINQSKGCGGIMRVAPIGLYTKHPEKAGLLAAQNAAMTHGHELGYIPAGMLGYCISTLSHKENTSLLTVIQSSLEWVARQFSTAKHLPELTTLVERAGSLAASTLPDEEAIRTLGEGWVAEETLAIAVYCALKYEHNFDRALIAAVNHDGDSDSTGAVTGNLLGTSLGLSGIPQKYQHALELRKVILELADDLCHGCPVGYGRQPIIHVVGTPITEPQAKTSETALWDAKYNTATYRPSATNESR